MITMNTGDMGKYCLKLHLVYFNAFPMWQQVFGPVQYIRSIHIQVTPRRGGWWDLHYRGAKA